MLSVVVLFYSIPVNPCTLLPSQNADLLAPATTKELYDSSELVVVGRITDSTAKCEGSQIWTHVQVQVEESLKNPQGIDVLTAKTYGGVMGNYGVSMEDSPIFNKGDRAFLYLYKEKPGDIVYRISPYSGALADETITGRDVLRTFHLQLITNNTSVIDIPRGTSQEVALSLESFFGYDSPTSVTATSFTYYNGNGTLVLGNADISALRGYGLLLEPADFVVIPQVNGTAQAEFRITVSDNAVLGIYDIALSGAEQDEHSALPKIINTYARVSIKDSQDNVIPTALEGVSVNIEKYGRRQFYQDENVVLPTNVTISDASAFGKDAVIAWPSIGPNYIIKSASANEIVFDYYKSLGIDISQLQFDESVKAGELEPPPAVFGRYFGFEWNQTGLDGTRVEPGTYHVFLTMPLMIKEEIVTLTSEPDSFTIIEGKPAPKPHNLSLEYRVDNTNLATGEPYSFSLYLVNNGSHSESFTVDRNSEEGSCYWSHTAKLEHPDYTLPPGGKINLSAENNVGAAPKIPGTYPYTPFVMLSIDELERVECLKVEANTVTLNVTATVYEGVKLVVATDKHVYKSNETVKIDLYIENNSYTPFKLQEIAPSITIKDASGKGVYGIAWIADYTEYPIVQPHSSFSLSGAFPLTWNQTVYLEDGSTKRAEPGEYFLEATFTYPYLESDVHKITIE